MGGPVTRRRCRKDANHGEIEHAFADLGCTTADLSHAGIAGWPDLVIGCLGIDHLVEVKNPGSRYGRAGLNANQSNFARDWRGGPIHTVASRDDVIALVARWRPAPTG